MKVLKDLFSSPTWKMLAPYGVLHAFRRLSFPVLTNHLPKNTQTHRRSEKEDLS